MPPSIEKLQKFLHLEIERGYDNRAVVGGLEKIIPAWTTSAQIDKLDERYTEKIIQILQNYPNQDHLSRINSIKELLQLCKDLSSNSFISQNSATVNKLAPPLPQTPSAPQSKRPVTSKGSVTIRNSLRTNRVDSTKLSGLNSPITVLNGIGPQNAKLFSSLGIYVIADLLYYFPRRYDDYSQLKPISQLSFGDELTVIGIINNITPRKVRGGQMEIIEAIISDGTGFLRVNWYNQPWLVHQLSPGKSIVLSGKVNIYLGRLVMNSPEWELLEQDHLHTNRIVPVYPLTAGITQRLIRRIMHQTISFWSSRIQDYLPERIRGVTNLFDLPTAIQQIHFPDSIDKLNAARKRIAFDEIFFIQIGVLQQKRNWESNIAISYRATDDWLGALIDQLPYQLTGAQIHAVNDIRKDLSTGRPMNRLLQGDVGSGKTIIAALGIAIITQHDAQAAIMAPTSILAEQHYRNLTALFEQFQKADPTFLSSKQIRLLIGDTSAAEKEEIKSGLADGSVKLVIGTHALIEEPVSFRNLQLVVVDEQHRFGVAQRSIMRAKGKNPHLLVMTATPIPRSLALTIYGDLDLTVMDELPPGRQPIETQVFSPLERERAYQLIRAQISAGHQAFIIYPLVEQGEQEEVKAAVDEYSRLKKDIFPGEAIGLIHGRLRPDEKEQSMRQFREGKYKIMVSTSVVEVGVDIPNATVMLIEGANRFGLAQLHQFRGRVGRGYDKSFCILIPDQHDEMENERLTAMVETNDGFLLAERDLEQRGPGDFLGTRQAGFADLKMANLTDIRLIEQARQQALDFYNLDPDLKLPEHEDLAVKFNSFWNPGRGDIS